MMMGSSVEQLVECNVPSSKQNCCATSPETPKRAPSLGPFSLGFWLGQLQAVPKADSTANTSVTFVAPSPLMSMAHFAVQRLPVGLAFAVHVGSVGSILTDLYSLAESGPLLRDA